MVSSQIPPSIYNYVLKNFSSPVGLTGCRAINGNLSLECCEYNLLIFQDNAYVKSEMQQIGNHLLQIQTSNLQFVDSSLISELVVIRDNKHFSLSSIKKKIGDGNRFDKYYKIKGKRALVRSLLYHIKVKEYIIKDQILAAMFLKFSSLEFLEGIIYLSLSRPSPLHQLSQIKKILVDNATYEIGIRLALEAIGLERASKSVIMRISEGISQLCSTEYDRRILFNKVDYMVKMSKYSDCYYYLCRIGTSYLIRQDSKFYHTFKKAIQISLDLDNDPIKIENYNNELFSIIKRELKN